MKLNWSVTPAASNVYKVRVGSTCNPVCFIGGTSVGCRPMTRYGVPSIRTNDPRRCGLPVQWTVSASVNRSAADQILK